MLSDNRLWPPTEVTRIGAGSAVRGADGDGGGT